MRKWKAIVGFAAVLLACGGGDKVTGPSLLSSGDFRITVGSGVAPSIAWPGGRGTIVFVVKNDAFATPSWAVGDTTEAQVGFPSPVTVGMIPFGADTLVSTVPLERGTRYLATVLRHDGREAFQEFIP